MWTFYINWTIVNILFKKKKKNIYIYGLFHHVIYYKYTKIKKKGIIFPTLRSTNTVEYDACTVNIVVV